MFLSTKAFLAMLARHIASGRPVLADCWCTNSSGVCVPSPKRKRALLVQLGRLSQSLDQLGNRNGSQRLAGTRGRSHIALHQAAIGLTELRQSVRR